MRHFFNSVSTWLKDSWKAMEEASLFTDDFVNGEVGVFSHDKKEEVKKE